MKKLLCGILAVVSIVTLLTACAETENPTTQPSTTTTTQKSTTTTTRTTTTTKPTTTQKPTTTLSEEETVLRNIRYDSNSVDYTLLGGRKNILGEPYRKITDYDGYLQFCAQFAAYGEPVVDYNDEDPTDAQTFAFYTKEFFEDNILLMVESTNTNEIFASAYIAVVELNGSSLDLHFVHYVDEYDSIWDGFADGTLFFITIPRSFASRIDSVTSTYEESQFMGAYKPVIYLYPETEMSVDVTLGYKDRITVSYPEYVDGWSVTAQPDGKLVYNETGRKLYSLYYESRLAVPFRVESDGFVVRGSEVAGFLEEKLAILGLNEYEAEEFIIYWLPILQANEYNYIRFASMEEIERNMPLEINPDPDSVIRVWMTFKGLDEPITVTEQQLITPERTGFVAVEWGGCPIA
ncbi:MAG: hypothetical protein IKY44_03375 [Clostridia bacterium]|nr:hypothetical protein [Clostridia bacterium]